MVDTDDTRRTTDDGRRTTDDGRRTTPWVWHKLPTGELKRAGIHPITGVQLISQICYKGPTYNHRKRSTKVKSDQV